MRQVLDGHDFKGYPNHIIDLEGELTNAEYHAEFIDIDFMKKLRYWRKMLQNRRFIPVEADMIMIDVFYYMADKYLGFEVDSLICDIYQDIPHD